MDDRENRKLAAFARAESFGAAHMSDFAPTSLAKQLFTELTGIVATLGGHASFEASGVGLARQGTTTRGAARDQLRFDLEAMARTARAMANDIVGIEEKFRLPRGNSDQRLIATARAFAADAAPFEAQFIAHELSTDFLQDLLDDIAALETAIIEQASGRGDHVAARAEIDENIEKGSLVMRRLDAIVKNKYTNNPGVLAEWLSASHTERDPRRSRSAGQPAPQAGIGPGATA